jgi:hypothetical protein
MTQQVKTPTWNKGMYSTYFRRSPHGQCSLRLIKCEQHLFAHLVTIECFDGPSPLYGGIHPCQTLQIDRMLISIGKNEEESFVLEEPVEADERSHK